TDVSGNLWLFGGGGSYDIWNTLWKYEFSSGNWTWMKGSNLPQLGTYGTQGVAAPSNTPGSRNGSVSWIDSSGNLWLFGGSGYGATSECLLNDLWKYDISSGN